MSDTTKDDAAPAEAPKKSKMPMIVMAVGILCMAGAGGIVFLGNKPAKADKPKGDHGAAAEHGEEEAEAEEGGHEAPEGHGGSSKGGYNAKLESFIANLESDDGEMHYVKCTLTVELPSEGVKDKLEKKLPRVRQDVLLYLSSLTMAQTNGGEAKKKLRDGLDAVVKAAAGKGIVNNVFVVEMVVQ